MELASPTNLVIPPYAYVDGALCKVTAIGFQAFFTNRVIERVTIPDTVTVIGVSAFSYCIKLADLYIPDGVTLIDNYAFTWAAITSLELPASITDMGFSTFSHCLNLKEINVDSNNKIYTSLEGVLINNVTHGIFQYPAGKDANAYTIPDSITRVRHYAFLMPLNL